MANTLTFTSLILRMTLGIWGGGGGGGGWGGGELGCLCGNICVMAPPIHLGAWSMAIITTY